MSRRARTVAPGFCGAVQLEPSKKSAVVSSSDSEFVPLLRSCEKRLQQYDKILSIRNLALFVNGMLGVAIEIAILQIGFVPETRSLENNWMTQTLKCIALVSTILLIFQLCEYYWLLIICKQHEWDNDKVVYPNKFVVLRSSSLWWLFLIEIIICLPTPIPFLPPTFDKLWVLIFLRIYLAARVIRDHTDVYIKRYYITHNAYATRRAINPDYTWFLSFKTLLFMHPLVLLFTLTMLVIVITGYVCYIFEREVSLIWTIGVGIYVSFISLITGWPTDAFSVYNPSTFVGKSMCITSSALGLLVLSMIIAVVCNLMEPSKHQEHAFNWVIWDRVTRLERESAASVIQSVYRIYRCGPSSYISRKYVGAIKEFRYARRIKVDLQKKRAILSSESNDPSPSCSADIWKLSRRLKTIEDTQAQILRHLSHISRAMKHEAKISRPYSIPIVIETDPPDPDLNIDPDPDPPPEEDRHKATTLAV